MLREILSLFHKESVKAIEIQKRSTVTVGLLVDNVLDSSGIPVPPAPHSQPSYNKYNYMLNV